MLGGSSRTEPEVRYDWILRARPESKGDESSGPTLCHVPSTMSLSSVLPMPALGVQAVLRLPFRFAACVANDWTEG